LIPVVLAVVLIMVAVIVLRLSAARLRPRAPEARSGRRAGEAGLDLVQKLVTRQGLTTRGSQGSQGAHSVSSARNDGLQRTRLWNFGGGPMTSGHR
jgi:hypothetical protein